MADGSNIVSDSDKPVVEKMSKISFLPKDIEVEVSEDTIILDAALDNNIHINHNCGGNCACSTCHVIVESGFEKLPPLSEDEEDMLDEAEGLTETSRLACQIKAVADLVIKIPESDSTWDNDTF